MPLLAPAFLAGLIALGVPIVVHLMHRERREAIAFPSLMFLRKIPYRSVRRQKLRHVLLFLARCLALFLLAFGFARPFRAAGAAAAGDAGGRKDLLILLDRSYSMGAGGRFAAAQDTARRALGSLADQDRVGLILFDERPDFVLEPTREHARARVLIDTAKPGSSGTRLAPVMKLAQDALAGSDAAKRELLLVSDCQRRAMDGLEETRLPDGVTVTVTCLGEASTANLALSGVSFDRDVAGGRERVAVTARVVNKSAAAVSGAKVGLEIAGRVVETKSVDVPASGAANLSFAPVAYPVGETRGRVRLADDALPADNDFHFALAPGQDVPVLIVEEAGSGLYLRRALAIGDRPRFRVETRGVLAPADLAGRAVVVLAGTAPGNDAAAAALDRFLREGGGVLAALGSAPWRGAAAALLPGTLGAVVDRTADRGGTVAYLDYEHPALELFKAPKSGDFAAARFLRYRRLQTDDASRALARLDDGAALLAEKRIGKGSLLAFASGFDAATNDLALQPVFLPLVHELVRHVAGHREMRLHRTVGEALSLDAGAQKEGARVTTPSGERVRLEAGQMSVELMEAGFYEVQKKDGTSLVAVNVDPAESDLAAVDADELKAALLHGPRTARGDAVKTAATPEEAERRQSFWWFLLAAAFVLLAAETAFSNRLSAETTPA